MARKAEGDGGLRSPTVRFDERSAMIWAPFGGVKLSDLRRAPLEDFIAHRAADIRARLSMSFSSETGTRDAKARGQRVDERVLGIPTD